MLCHPKWSRSWKGEGKPMTSETITEWSPGIISQHLREMFPFRTTRSHAPSLTSRGVLFPNDLLEQPALCY